MKLNKKGFTLIELLAVIVLLLAISAMAISSISAAIERNKEKQNNTKKEVIAGLAEQYYVDHRNSLKGYNCIAVPTLKGLLKMEDDTFKDVNNNPIDGYIIFKDSTDPSKTFYWSPTATGCYNE